MAISEDARAALRDGSITAEGVAALRRRVYGRTRVSPGDVEEIFALNDRHGLDADPAWPAFFVEALADYLVDQAEPCGYVSDENADWLIARIGRSNRVDAATELELLVKVLERAKKSPVHLVSFALEQVKWGVVHGEGAVGRSRRLQPGVIGEAEVELVRRVLYAFGGDGHIAVTRQEAAVLFDINDLTSEADNHPAWSDLFVKALANFLLFNSGYTVPTRQEALRRERWLDAPPDGVGRFMSRMLVEGMQNLWPSYRRPEASAASTDDADFLPAPRICDAELEWLMARMGASGRLHANERAFVNFLKIEHAPLPRKLAPLLDLAA